MRFHCTSIVTEMSCITFEYTLPMCPFLFAPSLSKTFAALVMTKPYPKKHENHKSKVIKVGMQKKRRVSESSCLNGDPTYAL